VRPASAETRVPAACLCLGFLAGCGGHALDRAATEAPRELLLSDFREPRPGLRPDVVELPPETYLPPPTIRRFIGVEVDGELVEQRAMTEAVVRDPQKGTEVVRVGPVQVSGDATVGRAWTVDSLVGQINGRPVFADEFLLPIETRLREFAAVGDRVQGRTGFIRLVRERFEAFVDSELVISESEAQLSPGQRQGLFAWLRTMQETEIAERGGSRAEAENSLREDLGMSIDEFLDQRRDQALAATLLRRKVEPRTIVSWRDIEREYRKRIAEFAPPPTIEIGRIRLNSRTEAERVERVKELVAEGRTLEAIAAELGLAPESIRWQRFQLSEGGDLDAGIAALPLTDQIKGRLRGLPVGQPSGPIEQREFLVWIAILGIETPPARSIYDPEVQLFLRRSVAGERSSFERFRYIRTLRSRWVSDEIAQIEARLVKIAFDRYWRSE